MKTNPFIIFFICIAFQNTKGQCRLSIEQVGLTSDTLPRIEIMNIGDQEPLRVNESTIQFLVPPTEKECLFILLGHRWITRVWIDSLSTKKELVVNYSNHTAIIKNGDEIDRVLENEMIYGNNEDRTRADSVSIKYVQQHPDQYFSLWLITHGLNRQNTKNNMPLLDNLSTKLKMYPEYVRMISDLNGDRKYPKYGDSFKEFQLKDKNGNVFNSSDILNKIIILHFWSNACGPCIKGMDALVTFYQSLDSSKVSFISISLDQMENTWKKSLTSNKILWTNLWTKDDTYCDLCLHYNLTAMPYFVIFNAEKKITFYNDGEDIALLKSKVLEISK